MPTIVSIPLSDAVMARLQEKAARVGASLEAIAAEEMEKAVVKPRKGDDLRMWAGSSNSGLTDVSERHHEYLGRAIMDELRGENGDDSLR